MSPLTSADYSSLISMPAMPPPKGNTSNFSNPETNGMTIKILNGLFIGLAFIMLLIRLFIRTKLPEGQNLGWDDASCVIAVIASAAHTILIFLVLDDGYGRHLWDIQAITFTHGRLSMFAFVDMVYVIAVFLIKFSILLLYQRLFAVYASSKQMILGGYVFITVVMVGTLGNSIARVTTCTDIKKSMITPFCSGRNVNVVLIAVAVLNTIADFYILAIPAHRVLKMHISRTKKIGVLVVFLGGLIACMMSLVRLTVITRTLNSPDVLWNGSRVTPFTIVEMNLGIICSCMMFIPAFFRRSKVAVFSMRSALLSKTGASLTKTTSADSQTHSVEQKPNFHSRGMELNDFEAQVPDLQLLTEHTNDHERPLQ